MAKVSRRTAVPSAATPAQHCVVIKPTHRPLRDYYESLQRYGAQDVRHESALRSAFQNLLAKTGSKIGWTLIPELSSAAIRPDGTFRDEFRMVRGTWEAKDTDDDLEREIARKIKAGYSLVNMIFEDTQTAILYQNGGRAMVADLADKGQLCDLLNAFFSHTEPAIEGFQKAVDEFRDRVPELAKGLVAIIERAHRENRLFQEAFERFFELCKQSLNPNLRKEAVDEMLVQHILTERLFRRIFNNPEFVQRNIIASEVEKVINALTTKGAFNRADFLKSLDRFYIAIEAAAGTLTDFTAKQDFLNVVYERFFQGYCVKTADTHGIVYTPQPIVDFMCASIERILKDEFDSALGHANVYVLDPCTGTGNFIVNIINRWPSRSLERGFDEQFFANEVMLMPYYIAGLNIERTYYERKGEYHAFEGLCFVDTLDMHRTPQSEFGFMNQRNTERVERQRKAPITVVLGNPPYNANQVNENDNNKNRKYPLVDKRIKDSYGKLNSATKPKLYEPYVRFFRWASDRLGDRDGIVCLVTNNSFVHETATDGLKKAMPKEFTGVYHLDLQGNVRKNPTLSGTQYNVFGIQLGVGITIAIRRKDQKERFIRYHVVPVDWRREAKLAWLNEVKDVTGIEWTDVDPTAKGSWFESPGEARFAKFIPASSKAAKGSKSGLGMKVIFKTYSLGVSTNRDEVVYDFDQRRLLARVKQFCKDYNAELDRYRREKPEKGVTESERDTVLDNWIDYSRIKWSSTLKKFLRSDVEAEFSRRRVRTSLYRPFTAQYLYIDPVLIDRPALSLEIFPNEKAEGENRAIMTTAQGFRGKSWTPLTTRLIPNLNMTSIDAVQCLPYYVYDNHGERIENITDWARRLFRAHFDDRRISKWDIFHYVYGILHHRGYFDSFADCLRRELPRIPLARNLEDFRAFRDAGKELATFHAEYESVKPFELEWIESPDLPLSLRVERMRLLRDAKSIIVNDSLTLSGIPEAAFDYRLGNRSAVDWVIDQYSVQRDEQSEITSDPNRDDDNEYIVRLLGQVVAVSVRTTEIVNGLPKSFGGPPSAEALKQALKGEPIELEVPPANLDGSLGQEKKAFRLRPQSSVRQLRLRSAK